MKLYKYILVVEDSHMFSRILKRSIEAVDHFKVITVESFQELRILLTEGEYEFFAALLDVNLPDAPNGEIIDYVLEHDIPSVVFTGKLDENFRSQIYIKGIVDYVLKEGPTNVEYMVSLLKQLERNRKLTVLIVDDSKSARSYVRHLLAIYQFNIIEAEGGAEALNIIDKNKIDLVLADFHMPEMDGLELTKKIRTRFSSQDMAIIGMSTYGNNKLSAHFLKLGGSDFITKPFLEEEFFCRINQNMDLLDHIRVLKSLATEDYLTGLYNRRYFFDAGKNIIKENKKNGETCCIAVLDIDFFKNINDSYGHDVGDRVLQKLGEILSLELTGADLVARYGGEEFCFLIAGISKEESLAKLDGIRKLIEMNSFVLKNGEALKVSASIWICTGVLDNLKDALKTADKGLYQAKADGRNKTVLMEISE